MRPRSQGHVGANLSHVRHQDRSSSGRECLGGSAGADCDLNCIHAGIRISTNHDRDFRRLILLTAAFSGRMRAHTFTPPPKPVSHPVRFRILSIGIGLGSIVLVSILLFGFVIFMNSWSRWHRYEDASYHHRDFQVTRVYYQARRKGGADVYASGTVDGDREWMNLGPYLQHGPTSQAELDSLVPVGTSISVYFFPSLKGVLACKFSATCHLLKRAVVKRWTPSTTVLAALHSPPESFLG